MTPISHIPPVPALQTGQNERQYQTSEWTMTEEQTEKQRYYDETASRQARDDLKQAAGLVRSIQPAVAIDCGCGAGADIAYLRSAGFEVHAFDIEAEAIARCRERFASDDQVHLTEASFSTFSYPSASLVNADAALSFCPAAEFDDAWHRIVSCLVPGGIFCGSFVGPEDTQAAPGSHANAFWPEVRAFDEDELRRHFDGFKIERWQEHRLSGTFQEQAYQWHIFAIVAQKPEDEINQ
jgi:SAM-dependent methyltransferase